jgi:hypothetical protein
MRYVGRWNRLHVGRFVRDGAVYRQWLRTVCIARVRRSRHSVWKVVADWREFVRERVALRQ